VQRTPAGVRAPTERTLLRASSSLKKIDMAGFSDEWVDVQKNTFTRVRFDPCGVVK
jgi:hypothetical protein